MRGDDPSSMAHRSGKASFMRGDDPGLISLRDRVPRMRGDDPQATIRPWRYSREAEFPACAGMIRGGSRLARVQHVRDRVPRMRGDDPNYDSSWRSGQGSHAGDDPEASLRRAVPEFPACAGMIRELDRTPGRFRVCAGMRISSTAAPQPWEFPACAGMIRRRLPRYCQRPRSPPRGSIRILAQVGIVCGSSPHARG